MRVIVSTGSSGGHIFPALAFLDSLKERSKGISTLLILPRSYIKENIILNFDNDWSSSGFCNIKYTSIAPMRLKLDLKNLISGFNFLRGSLESLFLLIEFKPDFVVGFGSIYSVPMVFWAWIFRIKTLIHEQNVIPGRANRLLTKFADRVAISFIETKQYLKINPEKIMLTGNPIQKKLKKIDRSEALNYLGFKEDKFTILVLGGSQGSQRVNTSFLEAISGLSDKAGFQVIHITGKQNYSLLHQRYKDLNVEARLFTFLENMQYAYSLCDLAVSRAGAVTIAELIYFRIPAIIIPYPFAYGHQSANARVMEKIGAAVIINDDELGKDKLRGTLNDLLSNAEKYKYLASCYENMQKVDSNKLLVDAMLSL